MPQRKSSSTYIYARGRRKSAVAMLRLFKGKGKDMINEKKINEIYSSPGELKILYRPFEVTDTKGKFYFSAKVSGGGKSGQLDAIKLAISRALVNTDESYKELLKEEKLLTCDSRIKERKKPGLKKARKKEQFSKR